MQLLFVTPDLPHPPHQGRAIRNFHLIRAAAARHTVDLLSFAAAPDPGPLAGLCRRIELVPLPERSLARRLALLAGPQPDLVGRLPSPEFSARLRSLLAAGGYDLIQVEGLEVADYALRQPAAAGRLVYDAHNVEHRLQQRLYQIDARSPARWGRAAYSLLQSLKLRAYERRLLLRSKHVIACSALDAAALRTLHRQAQITVVPNGVDTGYFQPDGARPDPGSLVFTGTMSFRPNIDGCLWFIERILPRIRNRHPQAHFSVIGHSPPLELRQWDARLQEVEVTGWVEDVRPYVRRAELYVAPLRVGGGTRLKVLEAMAMGKPVVGTATGVEGLDLDPASAVVAGDDDYELAEAVNGLLGRPRAQAELGRRARLTVESRYAWEIVTRPLASIYDLAGVEGLAAAGRDS